MTQEEKNALAAVLAGKFSQADRRVLVSRLGTDLEQINLAADTGDDEAWAILKHFDRRDRIDALRDEVERERPGAFDRARRNAPQATAASGGDDESADRWRTARDALGAALRLDRTDQMRAVMEICDPEHDDEAHHDATFLLEGEHVQGLPLFCDRLVRRLPKLRHKHRVVRVEYATAQGDPPTNIAAWSNRIRDALAADLRRPPSDAIDLIVWAAKDAALFLIVEISFIDEFGALHATALAKCLASIFSALRGRGPRYPVRVLVAVDHEPGDRTRVVEAAEALARVQEQTGVERVRLDTVTLPTPEDVKSFLRKQSVAGDPLRPGHPLFDEIVAAYERFTKSVHSFREVTAMLDRRLGRSK